MYDDFWLNRWALPIILTAALLCIIYYKKILVSWIGKIGDKKWRDYLLFILDGLRINLGDWRITIIIPIFFAIGIDTFNAFLFRAQLAAGGEPLWFALTTSGIFNPISEEFLIRGIFLGAFAYVAHKIKKSEYIVYTLGLLVTSLVFVAGHNNFVVYQITSRFSISILAGALYLADRRNLLPPIIAHSASNIFLVLNDVNRGIYI